MKIMISYFYQVRFFTPNMIPLSTAVWDPKWFHDNRTQNYFFKDKRGVYNGLRAEPFMPGEECEGLCRGAETCSTNDPYLCKFLRTYRAQLNRLNFNDIMKRFKRLGDFIQEKEKFTEEPVMVLLVHESFDNPCSESWPIIDWFKQHGYELEKFRH